MGGVVLLLIFICELFFVGQIKDCLLIEEVVKWVENLVCDYFDNWLVVDIKFVGVIFDFFVLWVEECLCCKQEKEIVCKLVIKKLCLFGKLVDCLVINCDGIELFIVEGDSVGGLVKMVCDCKI